jgi:hypothetical protein
MAISRELTTGETELARQVFGDSIDYAAVRIHDRAYVPFQPKSSGMTPRGELYMRDCYSADYSQGNIYDSALFIHEMTHVWQYQNKILDPIAEAFKLQLKHKFNYAAAYEFTLDKNKDLTNYGMEQQAAIIEQYFMLKGTQADVKLHEDVLKKFLNNPAYARRKSFPGLFGGGSFKP